LDEYVEKCEYGATLGCLFLVSSSNRWHRPVFKYARDFGNELTVVSTEGKVRGPSNEAWITAMEPLVEQRRIYFHIRSDLGFLRQAWRY
jgi:hypothetical protein